MIVLPAVEQWANAYTFSTTNKADSASDGLAQYSNFIVMVCPADGIGGLLFDGEVYVVLHTFH